MKTAQLYFAHALTGLLLSILSTSSFALPDDQAQDIKIQADSAFHSEKEGLTIYEGEVILQQGSLKVEADKITAKTDSQGEIQTLTATGKPAKFQQQPALDQDIVYGQANRVSYRLDKDKLVLSGNASIKQGKALLNSDKITYLANQQIFKAEQRQTDKSDKPQRVEMIIPARPKKTEDK